MPQRDAISKSLRQLMLENQEKTSRFRVLPVLLILTFLLIQLTSCGNEDLPTPAATAAPTPKFILSDSANRMMALQSLSFTLTHEKGETPLMTGLVMNELEGQVNLPDQFIVSVKAKATAFNAFIRIDVVAINRKIYMADPLSGKWQEISLTVLPFNFNGLGVTLADIMISMNNPTLARGETINGQRTIKIQDTITSNDLKALIPQAAQNLDVSLDLWLEEESLLLLKARIAGQVVDSDPPDVVRILSFKAFNDPVNINPPI